MWKVICHKKAESKFAPPPHPNQKFLDLPCQKRLSYYSTNGFKDKIEGQNIFAFYCVVIFDWLKGQLYKCPVLVVDMLFSSGLMV